MSKKPLSVRELMKKLKPYGVVILTRKGARKRRGKGSERVLIRPNEPDSQQGPTITIKDHGDGTEISIPVIKAVLRRFNIDEKEFWN